MLQGIIFLGESSLCSSGPILVTKDATVCGAEEKLDFFGLGRGLFSQPKQIVIIKFALKVQGKADKGVDQLNETLHEFVGLHESSDHSNL